MRVHNFLPTLLESLKRWEKKPSLSDFTKQYYAPLSEKLDVVFDNAASLYSVLEDLNWKSYRDETLLLDSQREEERFQKHLNAVENYFGFKLGGEAILFGAFACMDGYARFEKGSHQLFLGVDESHGRGSYLDILISHELTHVARESQAPVWEGFELNPKMTHDEFTENLPAIEHLMNEGYSCVISEILVPGEPPSSYAYQTPDSLNFIEKHGPGLDRAIHQELAKSDADGDYSRFYNPNLYRPAMPDFAHYAWAWQWVKTLVQDKAGGDARKLVGVCSREFVEHARNFQLTEIR